MNAPHTVRPFRRLSREEATNFVILYIALNGLDPDCLLDADGVPGGQLERAIARLDVDFSAGEVALANLTQKQIEGWDTCRIAARLVGYQYLSLKGLCNFLRSLPPGKTRKS